MPGAKKTASGSVCHEPCTAKAPWEGKFLTRLSPVCGQKFALGLVPQPPGDACPEDPAPSSASYHIAEPKELEGGEGGSGLYERERFLYRKAP